MHSHNLACYVIKKDHETYEINEFMRKNLEIEAYIERYGDRISQKLQSFIEMICHIKEGLDGYDLLYMIGVSRVAADLNLARFYDPYDPNYYYPADKRGKLFEHDVHTLADIIVKNGWNYKENDPKIDMIREEIMRHFSFGHILRSDILRHKIHYISGDTELNNLFIYGCGDQEFNEDIMRVVDSVYNDIEHIHAVNGSLPRVVRGPFKNVVSLDSYRRK